MFINQIGPPLTGPSNKAVIAERATKNNERANKIGIYLLIVLEFLKDLKLRFSIFLCEFGVILLEYW